MWYCRTTLKLVVIMLSDSESRKSPEALFADAEFVERLIGLSSKENVKRELSKSLDISDEKEIDALSHEVFEITSKLKKMSKFELLKISGGLRKSGEQGVVSEAAEVAELGAYVGIDLAAGNVPAAIWRLGGDVLHQGGRLVGSIFNLGRARSGNRLAGEQAKESMRQTDDLNNAKNELVDTKHKVALAALAVVGSAVICKMFKKKKKSR